MQTLLNTIGLDFSSAARTWLFTHDILSWYNKLNLARDNFFTEYNIFDKLVPASTGVGTANPFGAALTTEVLAIKPKNDSVYIEPVESTMQCSALDYKSSFSRAVQVKTPGHHRLYVSGTASINQNGETLYVGDIEKQIEQSRQAAEVLLKSIDMDWCHVVRSILYFKHCRDFPVFDRYCLQNNFSIPHVKVEADICRDNLLFELEIDAITKQG